MNRLILSMLPWLLLLNGALLHAAPVTHENRAEYEGKSAMVRVTVSSESITVAENLLFSVEVIVDKAFTPEMPPFESYGFSDNFYERSRRFRATDVSELKKEALKEGAVRYSQQFVLEPFLSGNYAILPVMISFYKELSEDGGKEEPHGAEKAKPRFSIMAEGFRIDVKKMPEGKRALSEIFGQADLNLDRLLKRERRTEDKSDAELKREEDQKREEALALSEKRFPWWSVWTLIALGIIIPLIWIFGRKRINEMVRGKPAPAHEIAYKELSALKEKRLLEQGLVQEFYYGLSFILRSYIGNRFGIRAENQTTEEFFSTLLKSNPFDQESENILREFSTHADDVKYSRYRPDKEKGESSFAIAKSFVDRTRQIEEKEK